MQKNVKGGRFGIFWTSILLQNIKNWWEEQWKKNSEKNQSHSVEKKPESCNFHLNMVKRAYQLFCHPWLKDNDWSNDFLKIFIPLLKSDLNHWFKSIDLNHHNPGFPFTFSALSDCFKILNFFPNFFLNRIFSVAKVLPSIFLIFCNKLDFQKVEKVSPFTILKSLRFLSLRYSADFRRSRLV